MFAGTRLRVGTTAVVVVVVASSGVANGQCYGNASVVSDVRSPGTYLGTSWSESQLGAAVESVCGRTRPDSNSYAGLLRCGKTNVVVEAGVVNNMGRPPRLEKEKEKVGLRSGQVRPGQGSPGQQARPDSTELWVLDLSNVDELMTRAVQPGGILALDR